MSEGKKEQIKEELGYLRQYADAGKMEAFLAVWLERQQDGRVTWTITIVAPEDASREQVDVVNNCMSGIAEALRSVVDPPVEVYGSEASE